MSKAVVEIDLEWKSRGTTQIKNFKGTVEEIATAVKKLDTTKFHKGLQVTQQDLNKMATGIQKNKNLFTDMGQKAVLSVRKIKKEYKKLHDISVSESGSHKYIGPKGSKKRLTDDQYRSYQKLNKAINLYNHNLRTGANYSAANVKRTRQSTASTTALAQSMQKILRSAQASAVRNYNDQIARMSKDMKAAGVSTKKQDELLQSMYQSMNKISNMDTSKISKNMAMSGGDDLHAKMFAKDHMGAALAGQRDNIKDHISKMQGLKAKLSGMMQLFTGAAGFTMVDIGGQLTEAFQGKRLGGSLSGAATSLAGAVGSIFGEAAGSIAGDIGKFAGTVGELLVNTMTLAFRTSMIAIGGFIKGFGTAIIGVALAPVTGGLSILAGAVTGVLLGTLQSTLAVWKEVLTELMDMAKKIVEGLVALFSAGFKIIGGIFKTVFRVISVTWNNLWKGMKEAVSNTMDFTLDAISKMTQASLAAFAKQETLSTKAAKETLGSKGGGDVGGMGNLARNVSGRFGTEVADTQEALFDVVSSGYQKMSEANSILSASARLAKQDSSSVANATNALITVYQNYGDQIKSVAKVSDILSAATTVGRTSLTEMGPALKSVIPTARMFNIQLEDVMVSISALTRVFGRGSTPSATRYLSRFLESVAQPSASARKELDKLGISLEMLQKKGGIMKAMGLVGKAGPETIRKFMPTIQARRAAALSTTRGQQVMGETGRQFQASLGNAKGKIGLEQATLANQMQKVGVVIDSLKAKYGGFLASMIKGILFNKFMMKGWNMLNKLINSSKMDSTLSKVGKLMKAVLVPTTKALAFGFAKVFNFVKLFAAGDWFRTNAVKEFALELQYLQQALFKMISETDFSVMWDVAKKGAGLLLEAIKDIRIALNWINDGTFSKRFSEEFDLMATYASDKLESMATNGLHWINQMLSDMALAIANFDFDFSSLFSSSGDTELGTAITNTFKLVLKNVEILFITAFLKIGKSIATILGNSANMFINSLKDGFAVMKQTISEMLDSADLLTQVKNVEHRKSKMKGAISGMTGVSQLATISQLGDAYYPLDKAVDKITAEYRGGKDILQSMLSALTNLKSQGFGDYKLDDEIKRLKTSIAAGGSRANASRSEWETHFGFDKSPALKAQNMLNSVTGNSKKGDSPLQIFESGVAPILNKRLKELTDQVKILQKKMILPSSGLGGGKKTPSKLFERDPNKEKEAFKDKTKGLGSQLYTVLKRVMPKTSFTQDSMVDGSRLTKSNFVDTSWGGKENMGGNIGARKGLMSKIGGQWQSASKKVGAHVGYGNMTAEQGNTMLKDYGKDMVAALKQVNENLTTHQKINMSSDDLYRAFQKALAQHRNASKGNKKEKDGANNQGAD